MDTDFQNLNAPVINSDTGETVIASDEQDNSAMGSSGNDSLSHVKKKFSPTRAAKKTRIAKIGSKKKKRGRPTKAKNMDDLRAIAVNASPASAAAPKDHKTKLSGVLKLMAEDFKLQAPQPTRTVTLRFPEDLYQQLLRDMDEVGATSVNAFMLSLYRRTRA